MRTVDKATFPIGTRVRIASRVRLEQHRAEWKYHHKLQVEQMEYGDTTATVETVSFYHGVDQLYSLENIPGIGTKSCLS